MSGLGVFSTPNMFGLNHIKRAGGAPGLNGSPTAEEGLENGKDPVFMASLLEALSARKDETSSGSQYSSPLALNNGALSLLYKQAMLGAAPDNFPSAKTGTPPQTATETGVQTAAPQREANEGPGDTGNDRSPVISAQPSASVAQVVYGVGNTSLDLVLKISNANTLSDRLKYAAELRDKMVAALKQQGYNAAAAEKADKLTVNGVTYDVIKAANGLGRNSGVQLLEVRGGSGNNDNEATGPVKTLFKGAETTMDLLRKISSSTSMQERRELALQMQEKLVSYLRENGYTASTASSPDKIAINGQTYDFLQGLNSPGRQVQFQARRA